VKVKKSKNNLSVKIMELGNIAFGTLFISQLIANQRLNLISAISGLLFLILTYTFAIILTN
jgi:hypothetical protein